MKFFSVFSWLFAICSCAEIAQDIQIEQLLNNCEASQYVDLLESYAQHAKQQPSKKPDLTAKLSAIYASLPSAADLQKTAHNLGYYVADLKQTAEPYAAHFASLVKDASKGLANSVLRNQCERPPSSSAEDLTVRFQTWGCNVRQTVLNSWEAAKPWTQSLWLYSKDLGQTVKEKVEDTRIYVYFFGEKKKLTWQEKIRASMKTYWQHLLY